MALNPSSLSFNGVDQYVKLNSGATIRNQRQFTFMAWFKVGPNAKDANRHHAYVERQGVGTGIRFRFTPVAGKLQFGFSPKDNVIDTSYTYNTKWDDRWHHAAFSASIGTTRSSYSIYLDAVQVAEGTLVVPAETATISDTASKGIYVGGHSRLNVGESFPSTQIWDGKIDDIVLMKSSVNQGTINTYMTSHDHWVWDDPEVAPENENTLAYWRFNEYAGNTTSDAVDSTRTGTLYKNGAVSSTLWTIDRPFMGDGLLDTTAPSVPTAPVTSNINADGFTAAWTGSTDNVWVQFYELQVSEFNNFSSYMAYDTARNTSKVVTNLLPGVNYYWRVRAFDAELNASAYTAVQSLTTPTVGDLQPPSPPTNIAASHVTHSSFRVTFDQSISTDVIGYKLDVGLDSRFAAYLDGYKGRDIGNTNLLDIFGTQELTSYYVRVRAYDSYDNESLHSTVLRVNTPRRPDTIPPQVVQGTSATGISSRSATLSWETGIDNVAVMGYYLDISRSIDFTDFVLTDTHHWQSADVGNVTDYLVDRLEPDTQYYYRVRAYDEAGNVSQNTDDPTVFLTQPSNMYEGGFVDSAVLPNTWKVDTVVNPAIIQITASSILTLTYDTRDTVGTPTIATLRLMPRDWETATTFGLIEVTSRVQGSGVTLGTREVSITQLDEVVEIDVSSLIGGTTAIFEFDVRSLGFLGYFDAGVEVDNFNEFGATPPDLALSSDPMSSTQPLDIYTETIDFNEENLIPNPSFESGFFGWYNDVDSVLTRVLEGSDGQYAARLSASLADKRIYAGGNGVFPTEAGKTYHVSFDAKGEAGTNRIRVHVRGPAIVSGGPTINYFFDYVEVSEHYNRYTFSFVADASSATCQILIGTAVAAPQAFIVDNFMVNEGPAASAAFNGNTINARWLGSAHQSVSRIDVPSMRAISPYIGDQNDNNSVVAQFMHQPYANTHYTEHSSLYPFQLPVEVNRATKRYTAEIPASFGAYNLVRNPSFEVDGQLWSGGTRVSDQFHFGEYSYFVTSRADYDPWIVVNPNQVYTLQAELLPDATSETTLTLVEYDASRGAVFTRIFDGPYGDGESWQEASGSFTTTNTTRFIKLSVTGTKPFYLDGVLFGPYTAPVSYRDGSLEDGVWEGTPHLSTTGLHIKSGDHYDISFHYTDPEGFFDITDTKDYYHVASFTAPEAPDDTTTYKELTLTPYAKQIIAELEYYGDDNENLTAQVEFKRTDLNTWSLVRPIFDRKNKKIIAGIPDLREGTSYTVRYILSDPDGVFGMTAGTVVDEIVTTVPHEAIDSEPHVSFGGFVLQGRQDTKIGVTRHNAFGFPNRNIQVEPTPRVDGSTQLQSLWRDKEIRMSGFISGDSRADLDDVKTALLRALSEPSQRLIIDSLSRRGRFYFATCEELDIQEDAEENIRHLRWDAQFLCADPFAYDVVETSLPRFTSPHNGEISLQNNGDVRVRPYMELTTTSSFAITISIYNTSTGERITPKATIIRGDRLTIDSERKSVQKNGVEIDYAGGFVELSPGANIINFHLASQGTSPTVNVIARWRDKYL